MAGEQTGAKKTRGRRLPDHIKVKTFQFNKNTVETVDTLRLDWHVQDPARLIAFNGTSSETAFVQALLMYAADRISSNKAEAEKLMKYFPENARGSQR